MKPLIALLLLSPWLACCARPAPHVVETPAIEPGAICRVGPDGGPLMTERGIGGTGTPALTRTTDRGIGGTGIGDVGVAAAALPPAGPALDDQERAGIVGIVTGFASICVDGLEVRFDHAASVDIDGIASTVDQLRAGQLVVIDAIGMSGGSTDAAATMAATMEVGAAVSATVTSQPTSPTTRLTAASAAPSARTISIRNEIAGPVEAVELGSGALMIAGQRVTVPHATWGAGRFSRGDWVSVSGLRQIDGTISASRLERAPVGTLLVRGQISRQSGAIRIGGLVLLGPIVAAATAGQFVTLSGRYTAGSAVVTAMAADSLSADPTSYFGPAVNQLIVQAFVRVERGVVWLNNGLKVPAGPGVPATSGAYGSAIVSLERRADGGFTATRLRYTDYRGLPAVASSRVGASRTGGAMLTPGSFRVKPAPSLASGEDNATAWEPAADRPPASDPPALTPTTTLTPALAPARASPAMPPATTLPVTILPAAAPPMTTPAGALPTATPPVTTQPMATPPVTTQPMATLPAGTRPMATLPAVTTGAAPATGATTLHRGDPPLVAATQSRSPKFSASGGTNRASQSPGATAVPTTASTAARPVARSTAVFTGTSTVGPVVPAANEALDRFH